MTTSDFDYVFSHNLFEFDYYNIVEKRTLRELVAPNVNYNVLVLCIEYLEVVASFELKYGLIHLLSRFNGLVGENPHKHLNEIHVVCSTPLRSQGITEDCVKLKAFSFSLQGAAKDLLYYLDPNFVTSWNNMMKLFLETLFLASRAASIRRKKVVLDMLTCNH